LVQEIAMKLRAFVAVALLGTSVACLAKADGSWLKKVPQADRQRTNPLAANPDSIAAGAQLYREHCAKCHGVDAEGKGSRPGLKTERLQNASDGELAWILKNGNIFKGMPGWAGMPEQERWQIIAFLRSLNAPSNGRPE
jgi:mono/diheme cytochrome c family protein